MPIEQSAARLKNANDLGQAIKQVGKGILLMAPLLKRWTVAGLLLAIAVGVDAFGFAFAQCITLDGRYYPRNHGFCSGGISQLRSFVIFPYFWILAISGCLLVAAIYQLWEANDERISN